MPSQLRRKSSCWLPMTITLQSNTDEKTLHVVFLSSSINLKTNGTGVVTAAFSVPSSSVPGTVSTIVLTAQSVKQTQSVNSAITQLVVLPEVMSGHVGQ